MKNDYDIAAIYREMELHLIRSLKRNLGRHLTDEIAEGFKWKAWQAEKLKELKRYQRQNKDIINAYLSGLDDDIAEILKDEFSQGALNELNKYNELFDKNMSDSFFKTDDRKVNALIKSVNSDMKTSDKAILRMMNDTYRQTIHKAAMFANNGVMTQKQAVDMATKDFLSRGLNVIEYKDGKRVNIASYSQMAVRTASQRAMLIGQGEFRKEIGENLVIISKHGTACKLCQPHESKVYIDDVYANGKPDGKHKLLSQAMKEGLFHPNCRHGVGTYYGLDDEDEKETTQDVPEENNNARANYLENQVNKYNRLKTGSLDSKNIDKYQLTMDQYLNELKVEEYNKTALNSLIQKSDNTKAHKTIKGTKTIQLQKTDISKVVFTPAKTIQEAEEYASKFVNKSGFSIGSKNINYSGLSVDNANIINKQLNELFSTYDIKKFDSIETYGKSQKKYWSMHSESPMSTSNFGNLMINKEICKNDKTIGEYITKGKEAFDFVINNMDKLSGSKLDLAKRYKEAGRSLVAENLKGMITHETGHHISFMREYNSDLKEIFSNTDFMKYAKNISGYATYNSNEYLAESFCAFINGERNILDPKLVKFFEKVGK